MVVNGEYDIKTCHEWVFIFSLFFTVRHNVPACFVSGWKACPLQKKLIKSFGNNRSDSQVSLF